MPEKDPGRLSIRAFARLEDVSDNLVRRALKLGDLHLGEDKKLDASLVGTPWRRSAQKGLALPTRKPTAARTAQAATADLRAKIPDRRTKALDRAGMSPPSGAEPPRVLTMADFKDAVARGEAPDLAQSERMKSAVAAANRLYDMEERAGRLLDAEEAAQLAFQMTRAFRDGLITWAARMGPQLAQEFGLDAAAFSQRLKGAVNDLLQSARASEADE